MANLGIFELSSTDGEYVKLSELTELTFTKDTKYSMQIYKNSANLYLCISETKPTEGGFYFESGEKFSVTPVSDSEYIWVNVVGSGKCELNIAS